MEISSLLFPRSATFGCVVEYSLLFIVQLFFCLGRSVWGLCWFTPGVPGGILCDAWCSPVWSDKQADLELVVAMVAVVAAHLFSQCNVAWTRFPWVRSSGCQRFDSPWCFISVKCGSSISARFWSHGAHAVWFCTLVAILDHFDTFFLNVETIPNLEGHDSLNIPCLNFFGTRNFQL
jgi:hypothetical protein